MKARSSSKRGPTAHSRPDHSAALAPPPPSCAIAPQRHAAQAAVGRRLGRALSVLIQNFRFGPLRHTLYASPALDTTNFPPEQTCFDTKFTASRSEVAMCVRQLIYFARVFAVLLMFGYIHLLEAQKSHMCCTVEDCEKRQVEPNLQVNKSVHLTGSLTDQSGAPFKLSKVELRRWISPRTRRHSRQ